MLNRIILIFIFTYIFTNYSHSDCILSGPNKVPGTLFEVSGNLIKPDLTKFFYYHRSSTTPTGQNNVVRKTFTIASRTWSSTSQIYTETDISLGGTKAGIIGSDIYLFITRRNAAVTEFQDIAVMKSTDGLTGLTFGSPTVVYNYIPGVTRGNLDLGNLTYTGTAGNYIIPFYSHTNDTLWKVGYIKTTDSGASWTAFDGGIYDVTTGSSSYGETAMDSLGGARIFVMTRNGDNGPMSQAYSLDGGSTWTNLDSGVTNLGGTTGIQMSKVFYDSAIDRVFVAFHDRSIEAKSTYLTYADPDDIITHPTSWPTPAVIDSGYTFFGYPDIGKLTTDLYLVLYTRQSAANGNDVNIYWVLYKLGECADPGNSICGNGIVETGEDCEVGTTGCSASCTYSTATCGNSVVQSPETCDDGNLVSGDGCSATCQLESSTIPTDDVHGLIIE